MKRILQTEWGKLWEWCWGKTPYEGSGNVGLGKEDMDLFMSGGVVFVRVRQY